MRASPWTVPSAEGRERERIGLHLKKNRDAALSLRKKEGRGVVAPPSQPASPPRKRGVLEGSAPLVLREWEDRSRLPTGTITHPVVGTKKPSPLGPLQRPTRPSGVPTSSAWGEPIRLLKKISSANGRGRQLPGKSEQTPWLRHRPAQGDTAFAPPKKSPARFAASPGEWEKEREKKRGIDRLETGEWRADAPRTAWVLEAGPSTLLETGAPVWPYQLVELVERGLQVDLRRYQGTQGGE